MSTESRTADAPAQTTGPTLEKLRSNTVLRCRNAECDVQWFFEIADGKVYRYHEFHDFERERVFRSQADAVVAHPAVSTAVLPEQYLTIERGKHE